MLSRSDYDETNMSLPVNLAQYLNNLQISAPDLGHPPPHQLLPAHCDSLPVIISEQSSAQSLK